MILSDLKGKINASGKIGGIVGNSANIKGRIIRGGGGTNNYEELENLPAFNDMVIEGNKDPNEYGIAKLTDIPIIPPTPTYNILRTKLYENTVNPPTIALSDSVLNYDFILFDVFRTSYNTYHMPAFIYSKEQLIDIINNNESVFFMGWSSNNEFVCYKFSDASNLYKSQEGGWMLIRGIYGIKIGAIV